MADRSQTELLDSPPSKPLRPGPSLPPWLQARLLKAGEEVCAMYGPRFSPHWERYVTHPGLFLYAFAIGTLWVGIGWLMAETWPALLGWAAPAAACLLLTTVFVLGLSSGYFTRVVVTNRRLLITQGYEVYRAWSLERLPHSLVRFRVTAGEVMVPTVDLAALDTLLDCSSDQFVESKTIWAFSQRLKHLQAEEDGGPRTTI